MKLPIIAAIIGVILLVGAWLLFGGDEKPPQNHSPATYSSPSESDYKSLKIN